MHVYATSRLYLSDAEAYLRITAARLSRRFPMVLAMLADGRLHLSAIAKLAPHLREDNVNVLLGRAARRSKRDIEILVAELAPQPDVPSRMRRLPAPAAQASVGAAELRPAGVSSHEVTERAPASPDHRAPAATSSSLHIASPVAVAPPRVAAVVAPIAPSRYKVQFTASSELHDKIERARGLLRHQVPDGDLAVIFDRAMTLLVRELERARFAATEAPRKAVHEADPTPSSRRIPDPIKRAVWTRDEGRCTFRDREGRRCPAREWLQFHHLVPFGQGGDHSPSNVTLRCAGHNAYQADLDFGAAFMAGKRASSRACERTRPYRAGCAAAAPIARDSAPSGRPVGPPLTSLRSWPRR